jgi:CheY-like chemotaxis protein
MILFVDDELYRAHYYLEELRGAFGQERVLFRETLDEAEEELQRYKEIRVLILDIMMPPRKGWDSSEVEEGLSSGIKFMEDNAALLKDGKIAIVILTNRDVNKIMDSVEVLRPHVGAVEVHQKTQTPAWLLPTIVQRHLKR